MSKFKVGDRVLVIGPARTADVGVGHVGMISDVNPDGLVGEYSGVTYQIDNNPSGWVGEDAIANTLTPGKTYTSANGWRWLCIYIHNGNAWLVPANDTGPYDTARMWSIDGKQKWAPPEHDDEYRIVFEPVREEWVDYADTDHGQVYIEYTVVDGKPDWENAKVTPCD